MKKILIVALVIIVGLAVYFIIDLNVHTHDKAKTISSDETYHWYICKNGCGEQLEKEKHNWDSGIISVQPTPSTPGVRTYQCVDCGKVKKEAQTYKAVQDQWEKAFSSSSFSNVTAVLEETYIQNGQKIKKVFNIAAKDTVIYWTITEYEDGEEKSYLGMLQDGNLLWTFTSRDQTVEEAHLTTTQDVMTAGKILSSFGLELGAYFSAFTYDESAGAHTVQGLEANGVTFTSVAVSLDGDKIYKMTAKDTQANGTDTVEHTVSVVFTNYGTTKPNPPQEN